MDLAEARDLAKDIAGDVMEQIKGHCLPEDVDTVRRAVCLQLSNWRPE